MIRTEMIPISRFCGVNNAGGVLGREIARVKNRSRRSMEGHDPP